MENMDPDVRLYSELGSLSLISVSEKPHQPVKKEDSSKANKSRRAISLDSGKEIMCTY